MDRNKILFLGIFLFLGISFVSAEVPSFDYKILKWNMCDSYNLTKYNCDSWWESTTNPYYTGSQVSDLSNYFNKTDIENLYYNKEEIKTLASSGDLEIDLNLTQKFYNKTEVEDLITETIKETMVNLDDKFVDKESLDIYENNKQASSNNNLFLIIIVSLVLGIGGFMLYTKKQKTNTEKSSSNSVQESEMNSMSKALNLLKQSNALNNPLEKNSLEVNSQTQKSPENKETGQNIQR